MEHHNNKDEGEMMRGRKFFGGGVLLAAALLLVAIPASASASSELAFTQEGNVAPKGETTRIIMSIEQECNSETKGTLGENPAKKVVLTGTSLGSVECETGRSQTGHVEEEAWASNLKLKVKAKIDITYPGPCVYEYTKFTPKNFEVPGFGALAVGETQGKLIGGKKATKKEPAGCATKVARQFFTYVKNAEEEEFQLELT
jgi:hypothetical protein